MIKDIIAWNGIVFQFVTIILSIYLQIKFGGYYSLIMFLYSITILSFLIQIGLDNLKKK